MSGQRASNAVLLNRLPFPADAAPVSVAMKVQELRFLVAVQALNRRMKTTLGIDLRSRRQGIVDMRRPGFFLKSGENGLLVFGRHTKPLDQDLSHPQLAPLPIPAGGWRARRAN